MFFRMNSQFELVNRVALEPRETVTLRDGPRCAAGLRDWAGRHAVEQRTTERRTLIVDAKQRTPLG